MPKAYAIIPSKGVTIMCLAIPSKVLKVEKNVGTIDVDGVRKECSLFLLEDTKVGDYVIVHAGFAIQKIDQVQALETLRLLREAAALTEEKE
jgi:hydrogenase expression/formation protein HypC